MRTLPEAIAVVALVAVLFVPPLFTRDPWNPDEPRYAEVAREMVVLGQYLVPHLNGEPYSDKPPLFFWLAALFFAAAVTSLVLDERRWREMKQRRTEDEDDDGPAGED